MTDLSGISFGSEIASAARANRIDPALLAAVAAQETGGPGSNSGRNITGDGGHGHGVFQIDDRCHAFARTPAAADPARNANYAAGMLRGLIDRYGGDVHKALSAYNSGSPTAPGTVTTWGDGSRLGYADSVLRHFEAIENQPAAQGALADAYAARCTVPVWSPPAASQGPFDATSFRPPGTPSATSGEAGDPGLDADRRLAGLAGLQGFADRDAGVSDAA